MTPWAGPRVGRLDDLNIVVTATFAEALFPYLIAIYPDNPPQPQFPEEGSTISMRKEFEYPSGRDYLPLKAGLVGLILLGSRQQLSPAEVLGMIRVDAEAWRLTQTNIPWLFDGERCEPLVRERDGGLAKVSLGPKPFTDLCNAVAHRPEIAAIRAVAFPVKPVLKTP